VPGGDDKYHLVTEGIIGATGGKELLGKGRETSGNLSGGEFQVFNQEQKGEQALVPLHRGRPDTLGKEKFSGPDGQKRNPQDKRYLGVPWP